MNYQAGLHEVRYAVAIFIIRREVSVWDTSGAYLLVSYWLFRPYLFCQRSNGDIH